MASGSNYLTTYYAKRIIGDSAASDATRALLQTGTNITSNIWILNHTKRLEDSPSKTYGIKYIYDSNAHDKLEIHGRTSSDNATAWVQLDTGDAYILGNMGIGAEPDTHKLYVEGNAFFSDIITIHKNGEGCLVISDGTHYNDDTFRVVLDLNPTSGKHGIWSSGYMNNGTFNSESKWILVRDSDGEVQMNGNASTATKLETPRKINNTDFDGSADITTDRWGTARDITIKDSDSTNAGTAVSVNGSAAVTLLLPSTIKASLTGKATSATCISHSTTADASTANNGGTAINYDMAWYGEKSGNGTLRFRHTYATDGNISLTMCVRNYKTSGSTWGSYRGITITESKSDVLTCTIGGATTIGGSITGTYFYSKHGTIDITASNNGVTSNTAAYGYYGLDKNGKDFTRVMPYVLTSGETRLYLQIRNHNGSAYTTYGGIIIKQGKSANTITYEVTDGANFRSAIGAGTSSLTIGTTATTAAAGNHTHSISQVAWGGGQNLTCTPTAANQEYSIDLGNAYTGTYWHVWSGKNNKSILICYNDNMNVSVPNGTLSANAFSGPLTGNVTGNCSGSSGSCTGNAATVSRATFGDKDNAEHNANNITSNGLYYYTSNGPATDVNQFKATDGAIYCQAYNTSWVGQIAQDYRNGSLAVRAKNNGTWQAWLSIPKMKVESYPALLPANGENNWIKVGTSNTSYGLLPSQSGNAGSGHNYLGTSSWYWKYAYVDEIYGYLHGSCTGNAATSSGVLDSGNTSKTTTFAYSKAALAYADYTYLAAWNGYELRAVNKSQFAQASHSHSYLPLSGGTLTGTLTGTRGIFTSETDAKADSNAAVALITGNATGTHLEFDGNEIIAKTSASAKGSLYLNENCTISADGKTVTSTTFSGNATTATTASACSGNAATASKVGAAASWLYFNNNNEVNFGGTFNTNTRIYFGYRATDSRGKPTEYVFGSGNTGTANVIAAKVYGAVWNDYAECRHSNELEPGRCVTETSTEDGMIRTTKRLMSGCKFVSDTYGMLVGQTEKAKTPIAVSGRVLAYPYRDKEEYPLGAAVCSAPNGTIDIMTREEIMTYPERIVGTVSEIPDYDIWQGGSDEEPTNIQVNGRIWIYVR